MLAFLRDAPEGILARATRLREDTSRVTAAMKLLPKRAIAPALNDAFPESATKNVHRTGVSEACTPNLYSSNAGEHRGYLRKLDPTSLRRMFTFARRSLELQYVTTTLRGFPPFWT